MHPHLKDLWMLRLQLAPMLVQAVRIKDNGNIVQIFMTIFHAFIIFLALWVAGTGFLDLGAVNPPPPNDLDIVFPLPLNHSSMSSRVRLMIFSYWILYEIIIY